MLSAGEIAGMRAQIGETLVDTAVIQTRSFVDNQGGGGTLVWAVSGTVDCHVAPVIARGDQEQLVADRTTSTADWWVTVPAETPITSTSRLTVGSRTFEVVSLQAPRSWELHRRLQCAEVE
jgi:head-tail adaptor